MLWRIKASHRPVLVNIVRCPDKECVAVRGFERSRGRLFEIWVPHFILFFFCESTVNLTGVVYHTHWLVIWFFFFYFFSSGGIITAWHEREHFAFYTVFRFTCDYGTCDYRLLLTLQSAAFLWCHQVRSLKFRWSLFEGDSMPNLTKRFYFDLNCIERRVTVYCCFCY